MLRLCKHLAPLRRPPSPVAAPPPLLRLSSSTSPPPSPSPAKQNPIPLPPEHLPPLQYARLLRRREAAAAAAVSDTPPPSPLSPATISFLRGGCSPDPSPPLSLPLCPGCGVHMQSSDPSSPGFFHSPAPKSPDYRAPLDRSQPLSLPDAALSLKTSDENVDSLNHDDKSILVCARCHSLRHYRKVKTPEAENLLPDFDFDRMVAPKMVSATGPRSIVLMIADAADFDGSFPRKVARLAAAAEEKNADAWKEGKPGNVPRALLVVTKIDLLPSSVSPEHMERWVRHQAYCAGAGELTGVHLVSAVRGWGVMNLVEHVRHLVGVRGNVWAVGAQNVGKSTLLNAMGRCVGDKLSCLTEAPVPGTTLGIVRVEGVLEGNAKLFDTPGILHPHQITMRLTREEQKLVHMSKELKPRTYRIKAGYSVHIAGLMRVDIEESSRETIYLSVWASSLLPLHMGKTENASAMIDRHFGCQLQPPIGEKRVSELGKWQRREFCVSGNSWDASAADIATAGLGWVSVALKGDVKLGVWTYDGIHLVSRSSLVNGRARIFEESGFTVSKIVSQADKLDRSQNKLKSLRKA